LAIDVVTPAVGVAYARAGLLGNPSDGYGGKVIAASVRNFRAEVSIEAAECLEIVPGATDSLVFAGLDDAASTLSQRGCEDGLRLLRATLVRFVSQCPEVAGLPHDDPRQRFRIRYDTDIPIQVGLSGSSAIVIAALRALMSWFDVSIDPGALAETALAVEVEELGLAGGPMDRVIQVYEGLMLMDLREPRTEASFTRLDPASLPPLFVAWDPGGGTASTMVHADLRARWDAGDESLREIMEEFRDVVDAGVEALERGDFRVFRQLIDHNFDMRASFFPISQRDHEMIAIAREQGAAAKLCGSGGAIIGQPDHESDFPSLQTAYQVAGFRMLRPEIA